MKPSGESRVLVALGASIPNRPAVETGVGLAAAVGAALEALFVEDANLLRLGALPFASETSALTGVRRALAVGEMERALRVEASRLERMLAASAARQQVRWSFAVTRGELLAEAMTREADLVVVGAPARPSVSPQEPGSPGPVATLFDASPEALRALTVAARLARALGRDLIVLVPAGDAKLQRAARQQANEWLAREQFAGRIVPVAAARSALIEVVRSRRGRILALPASALMVPTLHLAGLIDELTCPVVIVR